MTALIYFLEPENVILATDSLVTSTDLRPVKYCTKIFPLIHLNGVMCGTGVSSLPLAWFCKIQSEIIAKNMKYVNTLAPEKLSAIFKDIVKFSGENISSTIYHFGFDEDENIFRGYAYRSENKFISEELIPSIGIKPYIATLESNAMDSIKRKGIPDGFIDIMKEQKRLVEDNSIIPNLKVGIGGELHVFIMDRNGDMFFRKCHKFDDYSSMFSEMLINSK